MVRAIDRNFKNLFALRANFHIDTLNDDDDGSSLVSCLASLTY